MMVPATDVASMPTDVTGRRMRRAAAMSAAHRPGRRADAPTAVSATRSAATGAAGGREAGSSQCKSGHEGHQEFRVVRFLILPFPPLGLTPGRDDFEAQSDTPKTSSLLVRSLVEGTVGVEVSGAFRPRLRGKGEFELVDAFLDDFKIVVVGQATDLGPATAGQPRLDLDG